MRSVKFNGVLYNGTNCRRFEQLVRTLHPEYKGRREWLYLNGPSIQSLILRILVNVGIVPINKTLIEDNIQPDLFA
jgi:hypothetical protein